MPLHRFLEIAAWTGGVLLLATYAGVRTWSAQASEDGVEALKRARAEHGAALKQSAAASPADTTTRSLSTTQPDTTTWDKKRIAEYNDALTKQATPQAVLRIPNLKLEVPVYGGTSDFILNRGAGHIEGTATVDSETGNIGVAAHRDGFFRPLKDIQVGDTMFLDTVTATKRYRVSNISIVTPDDVSVLNPTTTGTMTLVTCYPFYFVGSAPKRYIVHAQLDEESFARGAKN